MEHESRKIGRSMYGNNGKSIHEMLKEIERNEFNKSLLQTRKDMDNEYLTKLDGINDDSKENIQNELWVDKYKPTKFIELLSNQVMICF